MARNSTHGASREPHPTYPTVMVGLHVKLLRETECRGLCSLDGLNVYSSAKPIEAL